MTNAKENHLFHEPGHDINLEHEDPTLRILHRVIKVRSKDSRGSNGLCNCMGHR